MKNSLFYDLRSHILEKLNKDHNFSIIYGGYLNKEQKEKLKNDICELIDKFETSSSF